MLMSRLIALKLGLEALTDAITGPDVPSTFLA